MKTAPDPSLKPVQFEIAYNQDNTPYPVILFNDGSIWRQCVENWHCVWPAPEAAEQVRDTQVTLKPEALQPDDVLEIGDEKYRFIRIDDCGHFIFDCPLTFEAFPTPSEIKEMLDRGVIVRRNGEIITGWPIGETGDGPVQLVARNAGDVKRIAELEGSVNCRDALIQAWKDAASVDLVQGEACPARYETPDSLVSRLQELYHWASTADRELDELRGKVHEAVKGLKV